MAKEAKTINIAVKPAKGAFTSIFRHIKGEDEDYDFSDVSALRQLLNKEKLRILDAVKQKKPSSLYALAKILGRDFKSVQHDARLLERFGLIRLLQEKSGKRNRLKPALAADTINIVLSI